MKELTLHIPSVIYVGTDSVRRTAQAVKQKAARVMVAADAGVRETGALDLVSASFEEYGISPILFTDIPAEGTASIIDDIADFARAGQVQTIVVLNQKTARGPL